LMRTMVLFDEIVEIFALPEFTRYGKNPCCLQFLERFRVCRVFVDGDHARHSSGIPAYFLGNPLLDRVVVQKRMMW
jgi:hypothetical protein